MVEREFPQVRLIRNNKNLGFAKANNQAMELSSGRYILLLNSDTLILDNAIGRMVTFLDQNPRVGLACCKLLNPDGTLQIASGKLNVRAYRILSSIGALLNALYKRKDPSKIFDPLAIMYRNSQEVRWMTGAFMMARKETINAVGMLDDNLFIYGEDNDWSIRVRKAGWKLFYFSGAHIIHYGGMSFSKCPSPQVIDWQVTSERYLVSKHYGRTRLFYWFFSSLTESIIKAGVYRIVILLSPSLKKRNYAKEKYDYFKYKTKRLNNISSYSFLKLSE